VPDGDTILFGLETIMKAKTVNTRVKKTKRSSPNTTTMEIYMNPMRIRPKLSKKKIRRKLRQILQRK
jgi:hypothetical protein